MLHLSDIMKLVYYMHLYYACVSISMLHNSFTCVVCSFNYRECRTHFSLLARVQGTLRMLDFGCA